MDGASPVWLSHAPDAALRRLVASYVGYASNGGVPGVHCGLPSARPTIVVAFDHPIRLGWHGDRAGPRDFWMVASGPHAISVDVHHRGGHHAMQLSLSPAGSRALFGLPAAELAGELVDLGALITVDHDALACASWDERFAMMDAALLAAAARTPSRHAVSNELQVVWSLIMRSHGTVRVGECASAVGWSRRRLLDRFTAEFGMGPKRAARVARLRASQRMLHGGEPLAGTAVTCGYADQSHLTREWVALTGHSPGQWLKAEGSRPTGAE